VTAPLSNTTSGFSRRRALAGVLGAGSILAACGGEAAPAAPAAKAEPTKAPVASAPTAAPAATVAATKPAATAVPAPSAAKGKVVFMTQGTDPADEARYKPLGELFNDKKGSVTVDIIQGDAGGGAVNAQAKLIALVASGTAPDVFWTHAYISPNLQKLNLLADISPYLASDKDVKLTDFFEAATKDYNVGGKQYGLPREATTTNLVYNKELFAKNGVSLPDESWTWETYLDAAKKMTGGTGAQATWGTAGWAGVGAAPYYPYIKVWQEGGDIVDATRQKFTLHQSPAVDQMQWIADLINKQKVHPFGDSFPGQNMAEAWNTGRIGMVPSISVYANFSKATFEWDIAPIPKGKSRVTRTASAGHSMTSAGKNKDAAWEFLKFLGSKAAYEHWAKLGLTIPTHKDVASSPLVLKPDSAPKNAKLALDAFAYAKPEPISGDWGNVGNEITKAMGPVYEGKATAKDALTSIVGMIEALLGKVPDAPKV